MSAQSSVAVRRADETDAASLAALFWGFAEKAGEPDEQFVSDYRRWQAEHAATHLPFVALLDDRAIGMAWLALVPRPPRPGRFQRQAGDLQSVFVVPELRSGGIGAALVQAVLDLADELGLEHLTVHSSEDAVALYRRAGCVVSPRLLLWMPSTTN